MIDINVNKSPIPEKALQDRQAKSTEDICDTRAMNNRESYMSLINQKRDQLGKTALILDDLEIVMKAMPIQITIQQETAFCNIAKKIICLL